MTLQQVGCICKQPCQHQVLPLSIWKDDQVQLACARHYCLHIWLFVFLSCHIPLLLCSKNHLLCCVIQNSAAFVLLTFVQLGLKRKSCSEQHLCAESDAGSDSVQTILNLLPDAAKAAILLCLDNNPTDVGEDTQTLTSSSRYTK